MRGTTPHRYTPSTEGRDSAEHLPEFTSTEPDRNDVYLDVIYLQFGVGSIGNTLMG